MVSLLCLALVLLRWVGATAATKLRVRTPITGRHATDTARLCDLLLARGVQP